MHQSVFEHQFQLVTSVRTLCGNSLFFLSDGKKRRNTRNKWMMLFKRKGKKGFDLKGKLDLTSACTALRPL